MNENEHTTLYAIKTRLLAILTYITNKTMGRKEYCLNILQA